MIRAVLFAVDNTLVYGPSPSELLAELLAMEGVHLTPEEVADAAARFPEELQAKRAAICTEEDEAEYHAHMLPALLRLVGRPGVSNALLMRLIENLHNYSAFYSMYPEVLPVLEALHKQGIAMGVVANWEPSLHRFIKEFELDHYFSVILSSREAGAAKPDPSLFRAALERSGIPAAETLHVGAHLTEDVAGAIAAGIQPVWLNRKNDPARPECLTITDLRGLLMLTRGAE